MASERTFRDGCVSFKNPCVTSIKVFEPDDSKSWSSTVLDQMRFNRVVEKTKIVLIPVLEKKVKHCKTCNLNDHGGCKI